MDPRTELIEKGIPAQTVEKVEEPLVYLNPCMLNKAVDDYSPDFSYGTEDLDYRLHELSVYVDNNLIVYKDRHETDRDDPTYYAFSETDFDITLVIEHRESDNFQDIPWIVDDRERTSFYFNNQRDEFLPAYHPEAVDPLPEISQIWKDAKQELEPQNEEITIEETFNRLGPSVRNQTRIQNIRE